jgi:hypothetical protein
VAATFYPFIILIEVGGPRVPEEGLGGELELGGRVGIVDVDVHISQGGFKRGDHTSWRGGTWTSYAGPDRDSEVTIDRSLFVDRLQSIQ